jgi:DNA-binding transcriptional LysR family regulator
MLNEIDLSRADLNLLVLFEAVMRERNVGRAAARLNLTASAVSHGLGRLRRLFNDPLFLRTPKGVVPTERAEELAEPIVEILARVRGVVAMAEPFDPATSSRRFMIGAPDAIAAVLAREVVDEIARRAPRVGVGLRHLLVGRGRLFDRAWEGLLQTLETREIDLAILPLDEVPARFAARVLYREDFVAVFREGHPFATEPGLDHYCRLRHLLVSETGHFFGFVDETLEKLGRTRQIAVTVPNFMMGLAVLAETDLIGAMPRHLAATHGARFALATAELPLPVTVNDICLVAPKSALMDAGIAWLYDAVFESFQQATRERDVPAHL